VTDSASSAKARLRRRRQIVVAIGGLTIGTLIIADQCGWLLSRTADDVATYHGRRFRLTRVIDGDTIEIESPDPLNHRAVTRVRLWGVNCPEHGFEDRPTEPLGVEATEFTAKAIGHDEVLLLLESQRPRDPFGSVLAHVELVNGEKLNEILLQSGLAKSDDRWPHQSLVRFTQLESTARRSGLGIWSSATAKSQ
jgi:endonuclease YncB( thermonuclease family)